LAGLIEGLSPEQCGAIEAIVLAVHEPYVQIINEQIQSAERKIVNDRFPVMREKTKAVDTTGRKQRKRLNAAGYHRPSTTTHHWLKSQAYLNEKQSVSTHQCSRQGPAQRYYTDKHTS
jgi:hypothetical protein